MYNVPVQSTLVKHIALGTLSLLGILVASATVWFLFPKKQMQPEDLLPADRTVLFLHLKDAKDLPTLAAWFPILREVPPSPLLAAAALLALDRGEHAWVFFYRPSTAQRSPLLVQTSSPQALRFLRLPGEEASARSFLPLQRAPAYRAVRSGGNTDTRLFLGSPFLAREPSYALDALLPLRAPLHVHLGASGTTITSVTKDLPGREVLPMEIPLAFADPLLVFGTVHPAALLAHAHASLLPSVTVPFVAIARAMLRDLFGEDLSPAYDLLPLLGQSAILQIGPATGSGKTSILLQGAIDDRADTKRRLEMLHERFRETLPVNQVVSRSFEGDRSFEDVRQSESGTEVLQRTTQGWEMRETRHRGSRRVFVTALSGNRSILSTSSEAVDAFLDVRYGRLMLPPSAGPGIIQSGGRADALFLRGLLAFLLPDVLPPPLSGTYRWSVVRQHDRVTLTVRK